MQLERYFGVYRVSLDTDMDGTGSTGCWIEHRASSTSASLAAAQGEGLLTSDTGHSPDHPISEKIVAEIAAWAEENGY